MPHTNPSDEAIRRLLSTSRTIAMVGASSKPDRPSHGVMKTLMHAGYHIIPVTPRETEVLGQRAYASLRDVPEKVDIVDVFRRAEETPAIADEAVAIGARAFWLQLGISSAEGAQRASDGGLILVIDKCLGPTASKMRVHPAHLS